MRLIFHIDIDAFFCSAEELFNPILKTIPFAIAGQGTHAIISTCNYLARKYGVRSAINAQTAKQLCPHITFIEPHHERYAQISEKFFNLLRSKFTNNIEQMSIDECFMDVTDIISSFHNNPIILASEMQKIILENLGLKISIGISNNKFLAKMATDLNKPFGISKIFPEEVSTKLWPLPIKKFVGIGVKTLALLNKLNIQKIGDLLKPELQNELKKIFHSQYEIIQLKASGKYSDTQLSADDVPKSISRSTTFHKIEFELDILLDHLKNIAEQVANDLAFYNMEARTITIQIKYANFQSRSKSKTFSFYIFNIKDLFNISKDLFLSLWSEDPVRLLGINCTKLSFRS